MNVLWPDSSFHVHEVAVRASKHGNSVSRQVDAAHCIGRHRPVTDLN